MHVTCTHLDAQKTQSPLTILRCTPAFADALQPITEEQVLAADPDIERKRAEAAKLAWGAHDTSSSTATAVAEAPAAAAVAAPAAPVAAAAATTVAAAAAPTKVRCLAGARLQLQLGRRSCIRGWFAHTALDACLCQRTGGCELALKQHVPRRTPPSHHRTLRQ